MISPRHNSKAPFPKASKVLLGALTVRFFPKLQKFEVAKKLIGFCRLIRISLTRLSFKLSERISRRKYPLLLQKAHETSVFFKYLWLDTKSNTMRFACSVVL